jgi:Fur family ferric uptake transcriptional regulator
VEKEAAARLRERGLRVTAQRLAVLRALPEGDHVTADAVARSARAEVGAISLQAVYDALNALVEAGFVRRLQPAGSPALFERRVGDNHHHVVCRACGQVADVDCQVGPAPCLTPGDDAGYLIEEAEVVYWGQCPRCRAGADGPSADSHPAPAAHRQPSDPTSQLPRP